MSNESIDTQNKGLRAYNLLKHKLREARSSTGSITMLAKPVGYAIEEAINSEVLAVLGRLKEQSATNEWYDEDEVMTNGDFIPLKAIEAEESKYGKG